ncbi:MAG: hypothetical protein JST16_03210 [Bdellovibrionales bacterium]|nr:hypothetical protein [Bdellovibrionales bacterium]
MPELPEVETARRQLERALCGQTIASVYVDSGDRFVFDRDSPAKVKRALLGAKVTGTGRKGKYLWLELDRKLSVVIHLGMSGNIESRRNKEFNKAWGGTKLWSQRNRGPENSPYPRFCRLLIRTQSGIEIAMTDPRRFGRIRLARDPLHEAPISKLGADPLAELPPVSELKKIIGMRRAPIKAVLLDQKIFAGVGNWLADEILFQAKISPHRLARNLTTPEIRRIRTRTLSIIRHAVKVQADYARFPSSWLFHDRWEKGQESYTSRGYEIRHDTVGGRTTAWVPALQK